MILISVKPTWTLDWIDDDGGSKLNGSANQTTGFVSATAADPLIFNWCLWRISQWLEYLDELGSERINHATNGIEITLANTTGHAVNIIDTNASYNGLNVLDSGKYGIFVGNCESSDYGPLRLVPSTGSVGAGLDTEYGNAESGTFAVDSNFDLYISDGSNFVRVGDSSAAQNAWDSISCVVASTPNNAVALDSSGLTMRKGAGAIRFDVNEDGSWNIGNSGGANIDFTTGDVLTITSATLNTCSLANDCSILPALNSTVITGTATTSSAVILDADGLTSRNAGGNVRFVINEDGSWTLGNSGGDNIDFTTGDVLTITDAGISGGTIDGSTITTSTLTTAGSGERLELLATSFKYYSDRGDATIINSFDVSADGNYINDVGSTSYTAGGCVYARNDNSTHSTLDIDNVNSSGYGLKAAGGFGAIWSLSDGDKVNFVYGSSGANYGVYIDGAADFDEGPLFIKPSTSSSVPSHSADKGTIWITSDCSSYINNDGSTSWQSIGGEILGDGTANRVLRSSQLSIDDGTNANTVKLTLIDKWNGDAITVTDNVAKTATPVGDYTLNGAGTSLLIDVAALSGDCIGVLSLEPSHGGAIIPEGLWGEGFVGGDMRLQFLGDITAKVDSSVFGITILYVTDA